MKYPWHVYRLFDDDGRCLYVGACSDLVHRLAAHHRRDWGDAVNHAVITFHPTKSQAHAAERAERDRLLPTHCLEQGFGGGHLQRGELLDLIIQVLREHGPGTYADVADRLRDRGWAGSRGSVGSPLNRMLTDGVIVVVGERPSPPGRWKSARIFGLAEQNAEASTA